MTLGANGRSSAHNSRESLIRAVADTQGGHIHRDQLRQLGLSDDAIKHLIRRGFLIRRHRAVYAVGHLPLQPLDRAHAALLAVGPRSALGHGSAGSYWGVFRGWWYPLEVVTPLDRRPDGVKVHHCVTLTVHDIHTDPQTRVRVTGAARTILDLTPRLSDDRVTRAVNSLRLARKVIRPDIRDVIARNPQHRGARRLLKVLLGSQRNPTRSQLEDVFMKIVRRYGLPIPVINDHLTGERVDFFFPDHNLIVEVDGPITHAEDPAQFSEDRRRDREIYIATGVTTIRFTYDDCIDDPQMVADTVRRTLARQAA